MNIKSVYVIFKGISNCSRTGKQPDNCLILCHLAPALENVT
jgi:hypothetical protein